MSLPLEANNISCLQMAQNIIFIVKKGVTIISYGCNRKRYYIILLHPHVS